MKTKRNYKWKAAVHYGERWWKPGGWWRYGLYEKSDNVGFSIGPILFYRQAQEKVFQGQEPTHVIEDEMTDWDHIQDYLDRLANGGVSAEELTKRENSDG